VTIYDVGVLRRNEAGRPQAAFLEKVEPGTSAQLAFKPLPPPTNGQPQSYWLPQWNQSPVLSLATGNSPEEKGQVRLTRLARLAAEQLQLMKGDVRLVGWTDEELKGMQVLPEAPQNKMVTLVIAHLVRGELPLARPDSNVAEDYYEPPLDPEIEAEMKEIEAAEAATSASGS
jgi:hypothetical protein